MLNWFKPELEVLDVSMTLKGHSGWGDKNKCDKGHHHHGPGKCPDTTPTNPIDPS